MSAIVICADFWQFIVVLLLECYHAIMPCHFLSPCVTTWGTIHFTDALCHVYEAHLAWQRHWGWMWCLLLYYLYVYSACHYLITLIPCILHRQMILFEIRCLNKFLFSLIRLNCTKQIHFEPFGGQWLPCSSMHLWILGFVIVALWLCFLEFIPNNGRPAAAVFALVGFVFVRIGFLKIWDQSLHSWLAAMNINDLASDRQHHPIG